MRIKPAHFLWCFGGYSQPVYESGFACSITAAVDTFATDGIADDNTPGHGIAGDAAWHCRIAGDVAYYGCAAFHFTP